MGQNNSSNELRAFKAFFFCFIFFFGLVALDHFQFSHYRMAFQQVLKTIVALLHQCQPSDVIVMKYSEALS